MSIPVNHDWLAHEKKRSTCTCSHGHDAQQHSWIDILLLAGGGIYFFRLIQSGNLANYVNMRFSWIVWLGMIAFFLLALAKLLPSMHEHNSECSEKRSGWKLLFIALPIALGLLLPSKPLNASIIRSDPDLQVLLREQVSMQYLLTPETIPNRDSLYSLYNAFMPDNPRSYDDPLKFTLLDWFRVYEDLPDEKRHDLLEGMPVDLIGFVYHGSDAAKDQFTLARFFMRHCMFDTIPIGLPTVWNNADSFKEDTWVHVQGHLQFQVNASGQEVLVVIPKSVRLTQQPETPYLYPDASMQ